MVGIYAGCDDTIMAATTYTYNGSMINPGHRIKSDSVVAVFTCWSGKYMGWVLTCCDNTIMAGRAGFGYC